MLQLSQCRLHYREDTGERLRQKVANVLRLGEEDLREFHIVKKSVDARKKPDIFFSYTVRFNVEQEERVRRRNRNNRNLTRVEPEARLEERIRPVSSPEKVLVVGSGPAGLFCAYYLALCGYRPTVIERGAPMEERIADVNAFWQGGPLCSESNVSFGEGGAGTFSDGKLNTGVRDRTGRKRFVLESFVKFGAGKHILWDAKPHVGTDVLQSVVRNMRRDLERMGCGFCFHTKMTDLVIAEGRIKGAEILRDGEPDRIPCDRLVLAVGHSARDTFAMLKKRSVAMSGKAFALGVRVQHPQPFIDRIQYGTVDSRLPAADYKCTGRTADGRGVYSFCMCPGGYVVNASSEPGGLAVNGMSNADRDSGYANSAIVVTVDPEDFGSEDVLAGVEFQRRLERRMYELAGGGIPVQRYGDFLADRETTEDGAQKPCVKGKWCYKNLRKALPNFVADGMIDGMGQFARRMKGFDWEDALLMGVESRTSSPVRIERGDDLESVSVAGVYPCGEGAGYAGGIMSAAMDGLRIAMKIQDGE